MKAISLLFVLCSFLIVGCVEERETDWTQSPTFIHDEMVLYGTEGKFGMTRVNGEENEPDFPVGQGRLYKMYFLDASQNNDGKKFKMTATHQDTNETIELYEWDIWSNKSEAKFGFNQEGLWKVTVTIEDTLVTDFIVRAEEFTPVASKIDRDYDFTYLEDLPSDKLEKYQEFLENEKTSSLIGFTPEEIVLIHMNLVFEHNIGKLYAIIYDGGQLPPLEQFKNEYDQYLSHDFMDDYLIYRFYDSITIHQETSTENITIVQMDNRIGSSKYVKAFALVKENDIWKIDVYPLIEDLKNKKI
ncbi:hypothetical protein ACIQ2D_09805 [Lysinibacillus sp. NPDC097287]|uniref:hypothetical protein n=1 Tax=Lysinibacillus sp. NPDC097287 TaxID=3364144 RepID=UPI0038026A1F